MPRLQSSPDRTQIKSLDEEGALVHAEEHLTSNLLVSENFAVLLFNTSSEKIFSQLICIP
jgi:hypothetical protein